VKLEGASAQGRPPFGWLKVALRTDQDSIFNNGIDNETTATVFKNNGFNG